MENGEWVSLRKLFEGGGVLGHYTWAIYMGSCYGVRGIVHIIIIILTFYIPGREMNYLRCSAERQTCYGTNCHNVPLHNWLRPRNGHLPSTEGLVQARLLLL